MSPEVNPNGYASHAQDVGILRRPDGTLDIAAYAKLAHRERATAIGASARKAIRMVREMWSVIWKSVAPVARPVPACGKRHASVGS